MSEGVLENRRNWPKYNESLVKRGELYLTFTFLDNWDKDLEKINRGKLGRKFESPSSFIQFLMMVHVIFNLPYRQIEGFLRKLSDIVPQIKPADYTTIWRRGTKLNIKLADTLKESDEPVVIALDSSGIKVTNRGEWMREKWKIHRGWIKVNISVNVKTKEIVGIEVTDETVSDGSSLISLVDQSEKNLPGRKIEKTIADGAFDRREIFDYLQHKHIQPVIKIRSNASTKTRGSPSRAKAVQEWKDIGYQSWKQKYGYGKRWAAETVFSSVKRISGEYVSATKIENMFHEAELKFAFYNILLNYR
jgi:hypothetical protein